MANPWFRMYSEFSHDPKVQMMSEAMQRRLVMLMCLRCSNDLETLHSNEIGFHLRLSDEQLEETKHLFVAKGFITENWDLCNWDKRQMPSDSSTERVREWRERQKSGVKRGETLPKQNGNALEEKRREEKREEEKRSARDQEAERTSGGPTGKTGSVGSEGEQEWQNPEGIIRTEGESDLEKSARGCSISGISPHVPDTNALEDGLGDTPAPPNAQQRRVEPPTEAKSTENQPTTVILDDWPDSAPARDEAIRNLLRAHPRPAVGYQAVTAAVDQITALARERGLGEHEAYNYLLARFVAYKAATDKWPASEKSFIVGVLNFLTDEVYRHDDAIWQHCEARTNPNARVAEDIQRLLDETGGVDGGAPPRTTALDAAGLRRLREDARARAGGPRLGIAHRRPF